MDTALILAYLDSLNPAAVYATDSVGDALTSCGMNLRRSEDGHGIAVEGIELPLTTSDWGSPGISPQSIISAVFRILTASGPCSSASGRGIWYRNVLAQLKRQAEAWENRRPSAGTVWNGEACVWLDDDSTDRITLQWADWFAPLALRFAKLRAAAAQKKDSASVTAVHVDELNQDLLQFAERIGVGFDAFSWDGERSGGTVTLGTIGVADVAKARALGLEILDDWEKSLLHEWST